MKNKKTNQAKRLVLQPLYRQRIVRDKTEYTRKTKHKKAPIPGGFSLYMMGFLALIPMLFFF